MTKKEAAEIVSNYEINGCGYCHTGGKEIEDAFALAVEALEQKERKQGHWRHYEGDIICSECHTAYYDDIMEYTGDEVPKYCPDCGAKMKGADDDSNNE